MSWNVLENGLFSLKCPQMSSNSVSLEHRKFVLVNIEFFRSSGPYFSQGGNVLKFGLVSSKIDQLQKIVLKCPEIEVSDVLKKETENVLESPQISLNFISKILWAP